MAKKKQIVKITEVDSDRLNGIFNLIGRLNAAARVGNSEGMTDVVMALAAEADEIGFLVLANKVTDARHDAGWCKDPKCDYEKHKKNDKPN